MAVPPAEGDPVAKGRAREQVAQCATDNQVLLHLPKIGPGGRGGPLLDECQGNHSSISTAVFTMSFQSGIRSCAMAFCGSSCLNDGSITLNDLALTAKGCRTRSQDRVSASRHRPVRQTGSAGAARLARSSPFRADERPVSYPSGGRATASSCERHPSRPA